MLTQAEIDFDVKMQKILMPKAWGKINQLISGNGKLAHYTTADRAIQILHSRSLLLRNARSMQDYSEVEYGTTQLREQFDNKAIGDPFRQAINSIHPDILREVSQALGYWHPHIVSSTYLSCFSTHDDEREPYGRLSMWRAFAPGVAGVAIVFNNIQPYTVVPLRLFLRPVMYYNSKDTLAMELEQVTKNINVEMDYLKSIDKAMIVERLYFMLHLSVVTIKHPGFAEEQEWRLCHFPKHANSPLVPEDNIVHNGIPQIAHRITFKNNPPDVTNFEIPELINQVIIGPSQYASAIEQAIIKELTELGVANPEKKVIRSDIPLRG